MAGGLFECRLPVVLTTKSNPKNESFMMKKNISMLFSIVPMVTVTAQACECCDKDPAITEYIVIKGE